MKTKLLLGVLLNFTLIRLFAQPYTSVNVFGDRFEGVNTIGFCKLNAGDFAVMGASRDMAIQIMDYTSGAKERIVVRQRISGNDIELKGGGGVQINDTSFVMLGKVEASEDIYKPIAVALDLHGNVIWATQFDLIGNGTPHQIIKTSDGGYLVSVLWDSREGAEGGYEGVAVVFKLDAFGNALWYVIPSVEEEETSSIAGMHELNISGNYILVFHSNNKLGMIKLNTMGEVLEHKISSNNFFPIHSAYHGQLGSLFIVCKPGTLVQADTSLVILNSKTISTTGNFQLTNVFNWKDTALVLGAIMGSQATLFHTDLNLNIRKAYRRNISAIQSQFQGLYELEDTFYSISSGGFAVTAHRNDFSADCFIGQSITPINVANIANPTMQTADTIHFEIGTTILNNINTAISNVLQASVNCLNNDLSVRPPQMAYNGMCRNLDLSWFVYNHGSQSVDVFTLTYYFKNTVVSQNFAISPLMPKTGRIIDFGSVYLDAGSNFIGIKVSMPNGFQDEFTANDSLFVEINTIANVQVDLNSNKDTICKNVPIQLNIAGPDNGQYAIFRDSVLVQESTIKTFNLEPGSNFFARYTSPAGCRFFSESLSIDLLDIPEKPIVTISNDTLFSDVGIPNYWYFGNQLIDSNKNFVLYQGRGDYRVQVLNVDGCANETLLSDLLLNQKELKLKNSHLFYKNTIQNMGESISELKIYAIDGRNVANFNLLPAQQQTLHLSSGIYFVVWQQDNQTTGFKIWVE
jgi:hypothetical protein